MCVISINKRLEKNTHYCIFFKQRKLTDQVFALPPQLAKSVQSQSMDGSYLSYLQRAMGPTDCKAWSGDFEEGEVNKEKLMINSST